MVIFVVSFGLSPCCSDPVEGLLGWSVLALDVDYEKYKQCVHINLADNQKGW